jgi:hypothetical protein
MAPRTPRNKVGAINDFGVIDDGFCIQPSGIPGQAEGCSALAWLLEQQLTALAQLQRCKGAEIGD